MDDKSKSVILARRPSSMVYRLWSVSSDTRNSSLDELLAHRLARSKETVLDRAERKTCDFRNLVIAHVVRMAQQDEFPVSGRKPANDLFNLRAALRSFALLFGREMAALKRQVILLSLKLVGERLRAVAVATQMVNGGVVRDLVNPGRELELGAVAPKRVVDLDEDLLRQIQRGFVIADHAIDVGRNRALVAAHQFLKSVFAPGDGPRHQISISKRRDTT